MATSITSDLLDDGGADVRELPADLDVTGLVREAAGSGEHGRSWCLYLDVGDHRSPNLGFGLRGDRGYLA